ncbi:MAG: T9SS type A sorting domain-containing protein [Ignavibacterium sp.]|nr:T9SS type A sorting domain-containing protein [Ignavibacterium sp.]
MKKLIFIPLLLVLNIQLFAQSPLFAPYQVTSTDYDLLSNSGMNNIIYKDGYTNFTLMIRDLSRPVRQIFFYQANGVVLDSLNVFGTQGGFPNIDKALTGSISGYWGISSETTSKIAIHTNTGITVHNTPPNPVFVFSNGRIFLWSKSESKLYRSDDLGVSFIVVDSLQRFHPDIIYNPQGSSATITKSKNEKNILIVGTSAGDGHVYSGIAENRADNLWIMYSTDYGNTWNAERIAADGVPNLINNYHTNNFAPLFENFGQVDGAIDDSGKVHIAANGYGVVVSGTPPYKSQFPMLYWNSITRNWKSISSINIDTLQAIGDYYPGFLIGQSYPTIVVTPLSGSVRDVIVCWTAPRMDQSNPSGLALSNGFYKTDAVYAYPLNIRHSDAWIIVNLNDLYPDDNMIYATVGPDYIGYSPFYIPLLYMNDLEAGISVLGQGNPTLNPIKLTLLYFELVSNDDIYSEMDFYLDQNYPNPFNPTTVISWQSPVGSHQTLKVYDVLGNEVATLVNEYKEAGRHKVEFDASKLASGVYIYILTAGSFTSSKKMMVVK